MSMNKIFSPRYRRWRSCLFRAFQQTLNRLPALEAPQISDRTVLSYGASATRGSDVSVTQQEP